MFGFQQAAIWGWSNPGTGLCIAAGAALLVVFYSVEMHTPSPLIQVSIFRIRPFLVENLMPGVAMMAFVPVFFFASEYAQISLGKTASRLTTSLISQGLLAAGWRLDQHLPGYHTWTTPSGRPYTTGPTTYPI